MKKLIPVIISVAPMFAFAATGNITNFISTAKSLIESVIPLLMVIATVVFLWGIISYIMAAGDEEKVKEARSFIIYGLIGLFVMVSVWGLVGVIAGSFGVSGTNIPNNVGTTF